MQDRKNYDCILAKQVKDPIKKTSGKYPTHFGLPKQQTASVRIAKSPLNRKMDLLGT